MSFFWPGGWWDSWMLATLQEWAKQCEKARKKGGRGLNQALRRVGEGAFLVGNNHG